MALVTLVWTQVHPSRAPVPMGLVPHSLGDEQHCHHSHSHCSQKGLTSGPSRNGKVAAPVALHLVPLQQLMIAVHWLPQPQGRDIPGRLHS